MNKFTLLEVWKRLPVSGTDILRAIYQYSICMCASVFEVIYYSQLLAIHT